MRMPWTNLEGPARLPVFCVTILLVASGLCGIQAALQQTRLGMIGWLV